MGLQDFFNWRTTSTSVASTPLVADEDPAADVDEPPDHRSHIPQQSDFHKSTLRPQNERKESLLTQALTGKHEETSKPQIQLTTELTRRRSVISNISQASTAELTSDGGLTSPARTNTPSPPPPRTAYTSFPSYSFSEKPLILEAPPIVHVDTRSEAQYVDILSVSPKSHETPVVAPVAPPKKRCISFQCGETRKATPGPAPAPAVVAPEPPKRTCRIKFACGLKPSEAKPATEKLAKSETESDPKTKAAEPQKSLAIPRKSPRPSPKSSPREHRGSTTSAASTVRHLSQSPVAVRAPRKCIIADEKTLKASEATRFHEFASEDVEEDDWIRRDAENPKAKITINDTLRKENAIRKLGNEAEEEALEDDEDEEEDEVEVNYSDEDDDFGENDDEEDDIDSLDPSDDNASDGNETDNEAGFAESDDESDNDEQFAFWTPGRNISINPADASTYRPSAHRAASASSIDSLGHLDDAMGPKGERRPRRRPIKIRPGTPELPDSTDFVCGTLDEDRPIENAYISCMEARKNAKHKRTPQDIDPSFPTSDLDEEDDDDLIKGSHDTDEHVWLHGKFEESDHEQPDRRRSTTSRRKSPAHSPRRLHSPPPPRRLHSPPPPRQRLRSPPPRKLFGHSPKRARSPPPARTITSPPASPNVPGSHAINFAPLAQRPGLTHTKSLPRAPVAFGRRYAAHMAAIDANDGSDGNEGHVRGAIDIFKGLEKKRLHRKEKFNRNRGRKHHTERRPQPGKGAERMREIGLLMAGKTTAQDPYMMSA